MARTLEAPSPDNCDITPAENAARVDAFAIRALTVALAEEAGFLDQARTFSRPSRHREVRRRELARRYAPRGPEKQELILHLLDRVALATKKARERGLSKESIRAHGHGALIGAGRAAFSPGAGLSPGAPRRRPKIGPAHDAREALWKGARLIARRGAQRCLNLECDGYARAGDYCPTCAQPGETERDHNRRLKLMEAVWSSAVPQVLDRPSKTRERRLRRSGAP